MVLLGIRRLPEISILGIVSRGRLFDLKIINSVLLALRDILFALSQLTRTLRSEFTLPQRDQTVSEKFNRCVSSAK